MDNGKRIQFHFAALNIEHHSNCSYDYLLIQDGHMEEEGGELGGVRRELGRYCSSDVQPSPLTSSSYIASLLFHTDDSESDSGFLLTWAEAPGVPGCGGMLTEPTGGEFSSPSHPETYSDHLNCEWLIRMPVNDRVKITFLSFEVEDHSHCR